MEGGSVVMWLELYNGLRYLRCGGSKIYWRRRKKSKAGKNLGMPRARSAVRTLDARFVGALLDYKTLFAVKNRLQNISHPTIQTLVF